MNVLHGAENVVSNVAGGVRNTAESAVDVAEQTVSNVTSNLGGVLQRLVRLVVLGCAIALANHLVAKKKLNVNELVMVGVTSAAVLAVVEVFMPASTMGSLHNGLGLGLGFKMANFPH